MNTSKIPSTGVRLTVLSLITIIPALVYLNSLQNTFVYDDYLTITNNHFIREWRYLSAFFNQKYFAISNELTYRPVVTFSYFVDYALWGLRPLGYHLTNILIHTLNVVLVYRMVFQFFHNRITAFISCLIFSIHPIITEAVNAISYREDLLSATFLLAAVILFLKSDRAPNKRYTILWYLLSLLTYFFALLSKEMAITLPLLFLVCDFILFRNYTLSIYNIVRRLAVCYAGYIAISIFYLFLRFSLFYNPGESVPYPANSISVNLIMMIKVLGYYIKLLFIPVQLNADYVVPLSYSPADGAFILSVVLLAAVIIISVKLYRLSRVWIFSILWFFITLLPVLNIIPINNIMAERYLYIPIIGFTTLFGSVLTRAGRNVWTLIPVFQNNGGNVSPHGVSNTVFLNSLPGRTWVRLFYVMLLAVVTFLFAWSSANRNKIWLNEFTFSTETIRRSPGSFRVYNDLGYFYYHHGQIDAAIQAFKDSIRIRYGQPKAHCNLGAAYSLKGLNDAAIEELRTAIHLRNQYPEAHNNLGILYKKSGMLDKAVNEYREALKTNPYYAEAYNNLGSALIDQGRLDEALPELEKAVNIRNNFALAQYNIAVVYYKKGLMDKAHIKLLEACQLDPSNADIHVSLGVLYLNYIHDKEKASMHLREALRINPKHKQAVEMRDIINKLALGEKGS